MNIFVSHSLKDQKLISDLKNKLEPLGVSLSIAEHNIDLIHSISEKIEILIRDCDVALILLTNDGFNSNFVHQEIGFIKSINKPSIKVVEKGLENRITGFIYGHDYILYEPANPEIALESTKNALLDHWNNIEKNRIAQYNLKLKEEMLLAEKKDKEAKIGLGILAGLIILGLASNSD